VFRGPQFLLRVGNPPDPVSNVVNGADGPVSYTLGNGLNVYLGYSSSDTGEQVRTEPW
jgi:hypothetical protein